MPLITIIPSNSAIDSPILTMLDEEVVINHMVTPQERVRRLQDSYFPLNVNVSVDVYPLFSETQARPTFSRIGLYRPVEFALRGELELSFCPQYLIKAEESLSALKLRSATIEEAFEFLRFETNCLLEYGVVAMGSRLQKEGLTFFSAFTILPLTCLNVSLVSQLHGMQISLKDKGLSPAYLLVASTEEE